jgi:flagellar basal-body rod protein FlgG
MGYKLQSSATLNPAQWTTLTNNFSVNSNNFSVTHPLVSSQMFFRLLPVLADSAAPADEVTADSSAVVTNFPGHVLARANTNPVHLLAEALDYQSMNMEVIANNLANIDTTGYKASQLRFQDKSRDEEGRTAFLNGAEPVYVQRLFTQGELRPTGNRLDLAIQGSGFFQVQMPDGTRAYTRDGSFITDTQGRWVTRHGDPVMSLQPVPQGVTSISISVTGLVTYTNSSVCTVFQIQLTGFANPDGLDALSANLFKETSASGTPERGNPGENGFGSIRQGFLELSNVNLALEEAHMAHAQQVYEMTLQAQKIAEKMLEDNHTAKQ